MEERRSRSLHRQCFVAVAGLGSIYAESHVCLLLLGKGQGSIVLRLLQESKGTKWKNRYRKWLQVGERLKLRKDTLKRVPLGTPYCEPHHVRLNLYLFTEGEAPHC